MLHDPFDGRSQGPGIVAVVLLLFGAALGQTPGQVSPSRKVTWQEMIEQSAAMLPAARVRFAPDHGRVTDRLIEGTVTSVPLATETAPQPQALCPGFPAQPSHSGTFGFQGLDDDNTTSPPDTMGSVGPRHVMTMLNTQVRIHNRNGGLTYSTAALSAFWAGLSTPFDPRLFYDNLSGRWIGVCAGSAKSANSAWEIIISATNDPTGSWTSYHFTADGAGTRWADYPCVGFNDKWVAVTFNMFAVPGVTPTPTTGPKMWVINKPQLLAGGTVGFSVFDIGFDPDNGFSLQPAVCLEPGVADLYILDSSGSIGDPNKNTNYLRMSHITGTADAPQWSAVAGSSTTKAGFFAVNSLFSNSLQPGLQNGSATALDSGDSRMQKVVYRNGHLWAVHGGGWPADTPDRNAIFWYELQPSLPNPIVQSGIIETGGPGGGYMYPSIAVNCGNDACIGFTSTSPAIFASACYVTRLAGDPPGTTSSTQYFKDGRAKYVKLDPTSGKNRWGDYSATTVDPLDDKTFWTLQEYAELPSGGVDRWAVQWAQITQACLTPGITQDPQSQSICLGQPVTFSINVNDVPVAEYQWNKNGTPIVGATFYNHTIPAVTFDDAGQYTCTVIGLCSAVTSNPATLTPVTVPTIDVQPSGPGDCCPGTNQSIVGLAVSGYAPITRQLQKLAGAVWQDVPGQVDPPGNTFPFTPIQRSDTGDYRIACTNPCGTVYTNAFHIQVGVSFSQNPNPQTKNPCESAAFSVVAQGVGALSYQWRHDGQNLVDDSRISGAITPALSIAALRYEDEGAYDCVVTDSCGPVASNPATIILPTPVWVQRSTTGPLQRGFSSDMAFDATRGVAVIYGGYGALGNNNTGYLRDTWEWDGIGWIQRFPPHDPERRTGQKLVFDTNRNMVLLVGGSGYVPPNNEVWGYDGNDWMLLSASSPDGPPSNAIPEYAVFDSARAKIIFITSVPPAQNGNFSATWEFDSATLTWALAASSGTTIGYYGSAFAYDSVRHNAVGQWYIYPNSFSSAATWTWNGAAWANTGVPTPPRYAPCMAFDTTRRRTVLYGCCRGLGPGINTTDTWAFDGAVWQKILPDFHTTQFDAVVPFALVYDSVRRAMVMVGKDYNGSFGDVPMQTWEYRYLDRIVFDRQPVSQPLNPGSSANFSVVAAGYGTLSYQWRRHGQNLADGPAPGGGTYAGATTASLTIDPVAAADTGSYSCLVSNACGGAASATARLGTPTPADFDGDGDVDLADFLVFQGCFNGPNRPYAQPNCADADFDHDDDVDLADFLVFQGCFNGPNRPPPCL
jgi:hypothetical protein